MFNPPLVRKVRQSLFLKILLVFMAGLLLYSTAMKITHDLMFRKPRFPKIQRMAVYNARSLAHALGSPLDVRAAQLLADSLEIQLRYAGPDTLWQSDPDIPGFGELSLPASPTDPRILAGFDDGLYVDMPYGQGGRFLFAFHSHKEGYEYAVELSLAINLAVTVLILFFMFLLTRHLLRPIRMLDEGVQSLSAGHLDLRLSTSRPDELGTLLNSFAAMVGRIREMLASRDQLLLDVSHELRSPLTRIKLSLEMMAPCAEKAEIAADIHGMEIMITELLETERLKSAHGRLDLEQFDLMALLSALEDEWADKPPGLTIEAGEGILVVADWNRMRLLLSNLLANGLKYADAQGGPVRLKAGRVGGRLRIAVENQGPEVPEAELPLVFEPFYRVDKSRTQATGGYGLGLSLARRIAEAHGGTLILENIPGQGVRSVLELPLA